MENGMASLDDYSQDVMRRMAAKLTADVESLAYSAATTAATTPTASATMDGLLDAMKRIRDLPPVTRDVFRFRGTLAQFKAVLDLDEIPSPYPAPGLASFGLGGLIVHEHRGECWIGADWRDIDDAIEGKKPYILVLRKGEEYRREVADWSGKDMNPLRDLRDQMKRGGIGNT